MKFFLMSWYNSESTDKVTSASQMPFSQMCIFKILIKIVLMWNIDLQLESDKWLVKSCF